MSEYTPTPIEAPDAGVSVVVPVRNGARTIRDCLAALAAQDCSASYEVIVVDNNSTDATPQIAQEFPVTLLHERERQSSYAARNRGILHARAAVVAFLDVDCIPAADWLREILLPFSDPTVGAVTGAIGSCDPTNEVEGFLADINPLSQDSPAENWPILITANAAVRKSCLLQVGMFDDRLYTGGDVDLGWRIEHRTGLRVVRAASAVVLHRHRMNALAMYRQFRRYGLSEILLDTMYRGQPGYFRSPTVQLRTMALQALACANYARAYAVSRAACLVGQPRASKASRAKCLLVAEIANLVGKGQGLLHTRAFTRDPRHRPMSDPGER